MSSASSFAKMATVSCSTKRAGGFTDGNRSVSASNLTGLKCTPLDPVDPQLQQRMALDTPHLLLQTFIDGNNDIKEGDTLTVSSVDYPIRAVSDWTFPGSTKYLHLILEDLRK